MDEKRCSTCRVSRPLGDFALSRTRGDGRQSRCRDCWRAWYASHREERLEAVAQRRALVRSAHQARLTRYLQEHPCVDCGEADLRVLDLDHDEPSTKVADVARLVAMSIAWERVAAEIAKCSVRCANCHRRRTAAQHGWWRERAEERRRTALRDAAEARLSSLTGTSGTMERPPRS